MLAKTNTLSLRFVIFWLIAMLLDVAFLFSFFNFSQNYLRINFSSAIAIHTLAAISLFFAFPKGKTWFDYSRYWSQLLFVLFLFLPFFGGILGLILFIFHEQKNSYTDFFAEDESFFSTQTELITPHKESEFSWQQKASQALDIVPLSEILSSQDLDLKRGAIEKLALMATPDAIETLLKHSNDVSAEIRFYISSALTRIKKSIDEKLEAAKQEMKNNVYEVSARLLLAKTYFQYAESHLLDEISQNNCLKEAIFHLDFIINTETPPTEAFQLLLKIYEKIHQWEDVFSTTIIMEKKSIISIAEITKIKLNYFFHTRKYQSFYKELKKLIELDNIDSQWLATANWWGVHK